MVDRQKIAGRAAVVAVLGFAFGCAAGANGLMARVRQGEWAAAVEEARFDADARARLAAMVLEVEAKSDPGRAFEIVGILAAGGPAGRESLERLAEGDDTVARLAWISRNGRRVPSRRDLDRLLADRAGDVRAAAAQAWARRLDGDRLARLLLDKDPRVRAASATWLAPDGEGDRATALLGEALRLDPDPSVRAVVARRGEVLGRRALELLREASADERMGVRHAAMSGLAKLGTRQARALLEDLAAGPMDESTVIAAAHLARTGSDAGRRRFQAALAHEREGVRATALIHLQTAGTSNPERIRLDMLRDDSPQVVLIAAAALVRTPHASQAVAKALHEVWKGGGARANEARDMLASLGDEDAAAMVAKAFAEENEAELLAILGRLSRAAALSDQLFSLLADSRPPVRLAAAKRLLEIPA